jgi:excinuclease ABC subunit A
MHDERQTSSELTEATQTAPLRAESDHAILVRGAREHNLRDVTVRFPRGRLTVITGLSGSGKSTLAFDTLYAEGQRRYTESVSSYARQFLEQVRRPDVDAVENICPAIAIGRSDPPRSARSTVGTVTEVYDALRLLWARAGETVCPSCGRIVRRDSPESVAAQLLAEAKDGKQAAIVAFPVDPGAVGTKALAERLVANGYLRIVVGGEARRIEDGPLPDGPLTVVADRVIVSPDSRGRLVDALEQAFRAGDGRAVVLLNGHEERLSDRFHCAQCDRFFPTPSPLLFSFNSPAGACPTCRGFGDTLEFDPSLIVPDPWRTLADGAIAPWAGKWREYYGGELKRLGKRHGFTLDAPWSSLPHRAQTAILAGEGEFEGVIPFLEEMKEESYKPGHRFLVKRYQRPMRCRACGGTRLIPDALAVRIDGRTIAEVAALPVDEALRFLRMLDLPGQRGAVAAPVLAEAIERLAYLESVGLPYLTLDRLARTLSGGEMQRIGLARALGANLTDTLYVLDEPTVGLHPRDTGRLLAVLNRLVDRGNTAVVVEHDRAVMERADWLIDLGPGAGTGGGRVVYEGPQAGLAEAKESVTARFLRGEECVTPPRARRTPSGAALQIRGATLHNLHGLDVDIPLGLLVCVTGVSGSGKSTLALDILAARAARRVNSRSAEGRAGEGEAAFHGRVAEEGEGDLPMHAGAARILGLEQVGDLILVDQSPISRSARSNPVSFIGAYTSVRELFGAEPEARRRGLTAGSFSFNIPGGRCTACEGEGVETVEMYWMADITVECAQCHGRRFGPDALAVRYRGKNIHEVLSLTVDEAITFFAKTPRIAERLWILQRVGLGYLALGQPAPTLSGGEAQRLKIARELVDGAASGSLYILDEPTTGLHFADTRRLLELLFELVDERGASVLLVEHNLDVISAADWVIDLGPEGGDEGGRLVVAGTPETVAAHRGSHTGAALAAARTSGALALCDAASRAKRR